MSLDEVLFPDAAEAEQAWATIARTGVWLGYVSLIRRDGTNCRLEVRMSKAGGEGEGLRYAALVFDADGLEARLARDRKSGATGKSGSGRVDLGGRRIIKKKKKK